MMNILLPTDFSNIAENAAAYALQLFAEIPAHFYFLHVSTLPAGQMGMENPGLTTEMREKFEALIRWGNGITTNKNHCFHFSCKTNYFIEAVRSEVAEKKIDLIIMGTRSTRETRSSIIGKRTADVLMKVKCPALAVSEDANYKVHKEVLFPTDYKINYSSEMLKTLLRLTSLSKASVKILELFTSESEPSEEQLSNKIFLKNSLSPEIPEFQTCYSHKKKNNNFLFGNNSDVDMIVMAAKNLSLCQKLLLSQRETQIPIFKQPPLLVLH